MLYIVCLSNDRLDKQIASELFSAIEDLEACSLLPSSHYFKNLRADLRKVKELFNKPGGVDLDKFAPLFKAILARKPDHEIWTEIRLTINDLWLLPWEHASSIDEVGWIPVRRDFPKSKVFRRQLKAVMNDELCPFVGLPDFHDLHFGRFRAKAEVIFAKCQEGSDPLFKDGWKGYPAAPGNRSKKHILDWFEAIVNEISSKAKTGRKLVAEAKYRANPGTAGRKLDFGFAEEHDVGDMSQIRVPGKVKGADAEDADVSNKYRTWMSIAKYAEEVLAAQDFRRFTMSFLMRGPLMQTWKFDRSAGLASDEFDVNQDGLRFVTIILGFLSMTEEELGLDPSIITSNDDPEKNYLEIKRDDGPVEKIYLTRLIYRPDCLTGRGSTCWEGYSDIDPKTPLVIKDS